MPRIFVAHSRIEQWIGAGRVAVDGDLMHVAVEPASVDSSALYLNPAVYFERVDGDGPDPHQLVGCVKSVQDLTRMGAEPYDESVVLGEIAYTVKPGFLAIPIAADGSPADPDAASWSIIVAALVG